MTIGQIKNSLLSILEDASEAELFLEANPESQFARRTYIRSIFSSIEGTIWILKDVCLNTKTIDGKRKISLAEYAILKEISFELKNNGEIKTSTKFLKLTDNIKFTFSLLNKLFNLEIDLDVGSKNWSYFLETIEIRNRITHPKKPTSFIIEDSEILKCKHTSNWFNELTHKSMLGFLNSNNQK